MNDCAYLNRIKLHITARDFKHKWNCSKFDLSLNFSKLDLEWTGFGNGEQKF